uniref:Uncharacterized protein n=1 Tax=Arundo donax TaxID=35708 RepID=A0A0A9FZJ8_ARUDO
MDLLPELTCLQGLKGWFSFLVNDCSVDLFCLLVCSILDKNGSFFFLGS